MASAVRESRLHEQSDAPAPHQMARGPLLVATDASAPSDAALRAAREIASQTGRDVALLAILVQAPITTSEKELPSTARVEMKSRESLQVQVEDQLKRVGINEQWPLAVVTGHPPTIIANLARRIGAPLVIMGLGGHGLLDRLVGDEMILQVLRLGVIPVLGVSPDFSGLPTRAVAAVDFSASSGRALALGAPLVRSGGTLTLAHVTPRELEAETDVDAAYRGSVGRALDRMAGDVGVDNGVRVERKVLGGDPAKELLALTTDLQAELIITGSHGHNFLSRLLLGSVSTKLLRKAQCSILVAPPEHAPGFIEELPPQGGRRMFAEWTEHLEEFTRKNAGRRAVLEVLDTSIGAQIEGKGVPFVGATFDGREGRAYLMFGGERGQHLTRSIRGVTAIQVLRDRVGKDLFLRVAHGRGQTLVTLER